MFSKNACYRLVTLLKMNAILTLIFPIFGEYEKGAIYILKVLEYIAKILKVLKAWKQQRLKAMHYSFILLEGYSET